MDVNKCCGATRRPIGLKMRGVGGWGRVQTVIIDDGEGVEFKSRDPLLRENRFVLRGIRTLALCSTAVLNRLNASGHWP